MGIIKKFSNAFTTALKTSLNQTNSKDKKSKRDKYKQQEFEINHEILYAYFRADPLINACTMVTVDNVCSGGWELEFEKENEEAEREAKEWEDFTVTNNWGEQLRNITTNLVVFDDCFQELIEEQKKPKFAFILNTEEIKLRHNEKMIPIGYKQVIKGTQVATFELDEVIHYRLNVFGDRDYGLSLIESVLYSAAVKKYAERFTSKIFENHKPRGAWIFPAEMSDDDYDDNVDMIIETKNDPQKDLFLKGAGIEFKSFTQGEDMQFKELISSLRSDIITGMLVPPIMLGIPEGSNKSNSETQMQAFDRRINAIQTSIEFKINNVLFKKFGFKHIKFRFIRPNKRDKLREAQIAQQMMPYATLNEVREAMGLPPRTDPGADEIMGQTTQNVGQTGTSDAGLINDLLNKRDSKQDDPDDDLEDEAEKSLDVKKSIRPENGENAPPENPISDKDEESTAKIMTSWIKDIQTKVNEQFSQDPEFKKAIKDPNLLVKNIMALFVVEQLKESLKGKIKEFYLKGVESVEKEFNRNFIPDDDAMNFLENYTFDLVKDMSETIEGKLRQVLRRGVLDGKGINLIKKDVIETLEIEKNRAETIARTETNRAANYGRLNAYKDAGVKKIQWLAMIDDRTSDICRSLNGQVVNVGELFKTNVNGKNIAVASCPAHPNCRSTIISADPDF